MSALGSGSLTLLTACLVLVICCVLGQNVPMGADFGLKPNPEWNTADVVVPLSQDGKHAKMSKTDPKAVDENTAVPEESRRVNVEDGVDLGVRQEYKDLVHNVDRHSNMDIEDDVGMGLNRHTRHRRPILPIDYANDIDLGLKHGSLRKEPIPGKMIINKDGVVPGLKNDDKRVPISEKDIKNYIDLGLRHDGLRDLFSDDDIQDDADLGLKHFRKNHVSISEDDLKNDIDFGLKHGRVKETVSDNDIKDDADLGLIHAPTTQSISDNDIKDDADLGLIHAPTTQSISDNDIKDDADLGLKHPGNLETISDHTSKKDVDVRGARMEDEVQDAKRRERIERKQYLLSLRNMNEAAKRDADIASGVNLGRMRDMNVQRRENSPRPQVPVSPIRRKLTGSLRMRRDEVKPLSTKFNQVVSSSRRQQEQLKLQRDLERQQNREGPNPVSGNVQRDNICHQYDVDGCSIPLGLPFPFKELFTNSCYRHDICYGCGAHYGFDRKTCDYAFRGNMWKSCLTMYGNGRENMTDPRKRLVVEIVDDLKAQYNDILRLAMAPVLTPSTSPEKDLEKLHDFAKSIQRKVLKEWVDLLKYELYLKKSFSPSSRRRFIDLLYSPHSLRSNNENPESIQFDNNLTTNLCEDILYTPSNDRISTSVEISCKEIELLTCYFFDYVYFLAVRIFAPFNYHDKPEFYCSQPFVKKCLPQRN